MTVSAAPPGAPRSALVTWLRSANSQIADWAASMSWWRLAFLFLLILITGSLLVDQLRLKHDWVRVPHGGNRNDKVVVTIGGSEGVRITKRRDVKRGAEPAASAPASSASATDADKAGQEHADEDADDEDVVSTRVYTFRGLIGDLGAAVMIILFAYLTAAKIVLRKVQQADAKVKSAIDIAEREAMERQVTQARLQVLQAQVEPHFLFNTLSAVDYLIETDPPRASQMQKKLIVYLRGALPQMRKESSTVGRELGLIRSYLDLIKMRIEERLEVAIDVPEFLYPAEFPPMMLQSLVENAIKHGIEPKPEGGKVTVSAKVQRGVLWLEVRDTGIGIVDAERLEAPTSGGGIGLQNIRERLAVLYPGTGRLTLMSDDSSGTVVRIGLPYREHESPESESGGKEQLA